MLMTADQKAACDQTMLNSISPGLIETLQRLMRSADILLQVPDVLLSLLDATGAPLVTSSAGTDLSCPPPGLLWGATDTINRSLRGDAETLLSPRDVIMVSDMSRDPRFNRSGNVAIGSLLCVPVVEQAHLIGILVAHCPQTNAFNEQHLRMLTFAAEQVALVIGMNQQAEKEAIQVRTKILSTVTHELRSPINTINGYLDLALAGAAGELNAELREFIQRARMGSESLFALLEDALLIARADAGQLRLSREAVSLQDVIIDAVEEVELTAQDHEISVSVEVDEELPPLYADASRLQQVVRNLLSNALQFTPAGGQVAVVASTDCSDKDATAEARVVKLQVMDTGCGIAPAFHQRIFERFFQVPDSYRQGRKGQGLGLAAVKMIVELHGGIISVESEPGQGSNFLCVLPVGWAESS
jgi:signal transduction histidine kinase